MAILTAASAIVHLLFAAIWTGSVVFVVVGVLPTAARDGVGAAALRGTLGRLRNVSRICALLLLLTGGHLAAERYTVDSLAGTVEGQLVLAMIVLWVIMAGLVEIGAARIIDTGEVVDGRLSLGLGGIVGLAVLALGGVLVL
jgi:hypothetical protein